MKRTIPKGPLRDHVQRLLKSGWTDVTGKRHLKLRAPDGRIVVVSVSPSDHRSTLNALATLRRAEQRSPAGGVR